MNGCPANCGLTGGCPQCNYRILPIQDVPGVPTPGLYVQPMPQTRLGMPQM
jgi:hypothetical protein